TFAMELGLAEKRLQSHDMHEGIEALLVRKSNDAQWDPATLDEVDVEALGAEYFKPEYQYKPGFVHDVAFSEYPHKYGLPTEKEIMAMVSGENPQAGSFSLLHSDIARFFEHEYEGKVGVRQKVRWVLGRLDRE
ncbi:3-hydroxyisobutyryl-CoA hydrolase, partial [Coemansia sp. RSA 2610]